MWVARHKAEFLEQVKNKLDIIIANEQEILSIIDSNYFKDEIKVLHQLKNKQANFLNLDLNKQMQV